MVIFLEKRLFIHLEIHAKIFTNEMIGFWDLLQNKLGRKEKQEGGEMKDWP